MACPSVVSLPAAVDWGSEAWMPGAAGATAYVGETAGNAANTKPNKPRTINSRQRFKPLSLETDSVRNKRQQTIITYKVNFHRAQRQNDNPERRSRHWLLP